MEFMQCYYLYSVSIIWPSRRVAAELVLFLPRTHSLTHTRAQTNKIIWKSAKNDNAPRAHRLAGRWARASACIYLISHDIYVDFRSAFALRLPLHVRWCTLFPPEEKTVQIRSSVGFFFSLRRLLRSMHIAHCIRIYRVRLATNNEQKYVTATIPGNNFHFVHDTT